MDGSRYLVGSDAHVVFHVKRASIVFDFGWEHLVTARATAGAYPAGYSISQAIFETEE